MAPQDRPVARNDHGGISERMNLTAGQFKPQNTPMIITSVRSPNRMRCKVCTLPERNEELVFKSCSGPDEIPHQSTPCRLVPARPADTAKANLGYPGRFGSCPSRLEDFL